MFIGVDIGGTTTKFGIFSSKCELLEKCQVRTDLTGEGENILPNIAKQIRKKMEERHLEIESVKGIGIGIPGPVDDKGYVSKCVNLHWNHVPIPEQMSLYFPGCVIAAENDANIAAFGEWKQGAGKGYRSMILVTLGTGVGGGVILDNQIWSGAKGMAGEIGHISVNSEETKQCNCGGYGCVDQYASATGIVRKMYELLQTSTKKSLLRQEIQLNAKVICDAAVEGDVLANLCMEYCMGALGKGLSYVSHIIDPEIYLIGGGVSKAGAIILGYIEKEYRKHMHLGAQDKPIVSAKLGNDAGIIGAAYLAAEERKRQYGQNTDIWRSDKTEDKSRI